uniref:X-ray radiation resistance associated 1 n=1 Tax=Pelusios castaneus TaxID=367368 RepID=A0A8C8SKG3_9SAUR
SESVTVWQRSTSQRLRFPSLEILLLDDNDLSHPSIFVSLANLRSLKQLNLDRNGISEVPYLHQMENSQFSLHPPSAKMSTKAKSRSCPSRVGQKEELQLQAGAGLQGELVMEKEQLEYLILRNSKDPDRTGNCSCLSFTGTNISIQSVGEGSGFVYVCPSLCVAGDPPLLTSFLQQRLGIKLIRRKVSKLEKPHIFIPAKANRKITSHVPKVPKQPLMLEAPLESFFWKLWSDPEGSKPEENDEGSHSLSLSAPLPPIRPSSAQQNQEPHDDANMLGSQSEALEKETCDSKLDPGRAQDDTDLFFLTQVRAHVLCIILYLQARQRKKPRTLSSSTYLPTKYKGYEELLRVKIDPDFIEPVGTQQNVQALARALKQPLVYRDSKARLDSLQKPYVPQKKKLGKPPGPPSGKTKAEVLEDILLTMRGNTNITEVPLGTFPCCCSLACEDCDRTDLGRCRAHLHYEVFEICASNLYGPVAIGSRFVTQVIYIPALIFDSALGNVTSLCFSFPIPLARRY